MNIIGKGDKKILLEASEVEEEYKNEVSASFNDDSND